jgi:hypothetical protein
MRAGLSSAAERASTRAASSAASVARSAPACRPPPAFSLRSADSIGRASASRLAFEGGGPSLATGRSFRPRPDSASVPSKSSSWQAASPSVGGGFARIATLECCLGDLANHSPKLATRRERLGRTPSRAGTARFDLRLALSTYPCSYDRRRSSPSRRWSAAVLTSMAGETQMHHFDAHQMACCDPDESPGSRRPYARRKCRTGKSASVSRGSSVACLSS